MDDDIITFTESLSELMNAVCFLNNKFGFLSSYAQFMDDTPYIMNLPSTYDDSNWVCQHDFLNAGVVEIKRATFVSLLILELLF